MQYYLLLLLLLLLLHSQWKYGRKADESDRLIMNTVIMTIVEMKRGSQIIQPANRHNWREKWAEMIHNNYMQNNV